MSLVKRIFNSNNFILLSSIVTIVVAFSNLIESFVGLDDLIYHKGIMVEKRLSTMPRNLETSGKNREKDAVNVFNFTIVGDSTNYTGSMFPIKLYNLLQPGDTITFYTREITSRFGNMTTNGEGSSWNTHSPNEVFHLVSNNYPSPIMNFNDHIRSLRSNFWIGLFIAVVFFVWYMLRRAGFTGIYLKHQISYFPP